MTRAPQTATERSTNVATPWTLLRLCLRRPSWLVHTWTAGRDPFVEWVS